VVVTKKRRPLTDEEIKRLENVQARIERAENEWNDALEDRNGLYVELWEDGAGVTAMSRITGQDRTTVQRIVTPPKTARKS